VTDADPGRDLCELDRAAGAALDWLDRDGERLAVVVEDVSKWSPRMQLDHAALATRSICGAVELILAGDPRCVAAGPRGENLSAILTTGFIPRGRAEAPDSMKPAPDVGHAATREHLVTLRERLAALAPRADAIAAATLRFPHFALGPMTAAEWLRFARIHFDHHVAIAHDAIDG
jgi:hypothetical protein